MCYITEFYYEECLIDSDWSWAVQTGWKPDQNFNRPEHGWSCGCRGTWPLTWCEGFQLDHPWREQNQQEMVPLVVFRPSACLQAAAPHPGDKEPDGWGLQVQWEKAALEEAAADSSRSLIGCELWPVPALILLFLRSDKQQRIFIALLPVALMEPSITTAAAQQGAQQLLLSHIYVNQAPVHSDPDNQQN